MKNIVLIIGGLIFSLLFYQKDIGLNLTLFSILIISVSFLFNKDAFRKKTTLILCCIYLMTSVIAFFYSSSLCLLTNFIALITFIGHISEKESSIYIKWLNGLYTLSAGYFCRNFELQTQEQNLKPKKEIDYLYWLKIIGIPTVTVIIFINLYRKGNPLFEELISNIDFSFISFSWMLLALLGCYILYNISIPLIVNPYTKIDLAKTNILSITKKFCIDQAKKENELGSILIIVLNLLIAIYIITDISYIISNNTTCGPEIKNQVHNSIYALIASIIFAIAIILYFFRGDLNFYKKNKLLKQLTYLWIFLNLTLVATTAYKDFLYITNFGLTYKRIGVIIYLTLTISGLATTFIKIKDIKNFTFLMRTNMIIAFILLMCSSLVNWDKQITYYNFNKKKAMNVDYSIKLSNNNTLLLKEYNNHKSLTEEQHKAIDLKYKNYINDLRHKNWQEMQYNNFKIKF